MCRPLRQSCVGHLRPLRQSCASAGGRRRMYLPRMWLPCASLVGEQYMMRFLFANVAVDISPIAEWVLRIVEFFALRILHTAPFVIAFWRIHSACVRKSHFATIYARAPFLVALRLPLSVGRILRHWAWILWPARACRLRGSSCCCAVSFLNPTRVHWR